MTIANSWQGIDAIVLAGGLGTRLRPALPDRPKVLAEIEGRPFLEIVFDVLVHAGLKRIVLALGHRAADIEAYILEHPRSEVEVVTSTEPVPLGTGGAVRYALSCTAADTLLVLNGDSFAAADLIAFREFHSYTRAIASLLVVPVPISAPGRYGRVEVDTEGHVRRFVEKSGPESGQGYINAGIYLLERAAVTALPEGVSLSLETEMFPSLVGRNLWAMVQDVPFIDIGTPESWRDAGQFFAALPKRNAQ